VTPSDEQLMVRVQAGDDAALGELLDRFRGRLFAFLARRVGASAAEDLFQETWLRVVRARASFDPTRRFSTWLFQIANNLCRDRGRRRRVEDGWKDAMREQVRSAPGRLEPPPLDLRLDMHRRLQALSETFREVLILRYYHHLSEAEIAEILGIPRGTVKSRLHHAVRALRRQEADA
jgi:RNA polymerase sigma-70 factor (ECF subfamily)